MHIAVKAGEEQKREFLSKAIPSNITIQWLGKEDALDLVNADAYFDLFFSNEFIAANEFIVHKPVFADAVCYTAKEIGHSNYIRINAWSGFLAEDKIEIAALNEGAKEQAEKILQALGWKYNWVQDEPGMIAPRVIGMIINEAYFGLGEGLSTKEGIDIAMKLGTNYPFGPFEWGAKIGLEKIYYLLKKLQQQNGTRYLVAPLLEQEVMQHGFTA